jgi:hypothetical protein
MVEVAREVDVPVWVGVQVPVHVAVEVRSS